MELDINFDVPRARRLLRENSYQNLARLLRNSFKIYRDPADNPLKYAFSEDILIFMETTLEECVQKELDNDLISVYKQLFKCLRNYVINCQVQNYLASNTRLLSVTNNLITDMLQSDLDFKASLQVILQFLVNFVVYSRDASFAVIDILFANVARALESNVCPYEASALLYNVSIYKSVDELLLNDDKYLSIFKCYEEGEAQDIDREFLHFLLESFTKSEKFWEQYSNLELKRRVTILEILREKQIKSPTPTAIQLPKNSLTILTKLFIESSSVIFQTATSPDSEVLEAHEVSVMLEVLASLCSHEPYLKLLGNNKDFLIHCGVVLINMHRLGKESDNYFTAIQKLAELREPTEVMRKHPAFGFKVNLVRIIGNMCCDNKIIQDLVREAELIPVILDCCNMDARNPFIMQWVILAIKNLCKGNPTNQEFMASLHQQGTVSTSTLEEMGLTLQSAGDRSIKIVPLDSLKK